MSLKQVRRKSGIKKNKQRKCVMLRNAFRGARDTYGTDVFERCVLEHPARQSTFCNKHQPHRRCPTWKKACKSHGKQNHFAVCCKTRNIVAVDRLSDAFEQESEFKLFTVGISSLANDIGHDWLIDARVGRQTVTFKVDTGTRANLLPRSVWKTWPCDEDMP